MADTSMNFVTSNDERWYRDPKNPSREYAGVTAILSSRSKPAIDKAKLNAAVLYLARHRKELAGETQKFITDMMKDENVFLPDWQIARDSGTQIHQVIENIEAGVDPAHNLVHVQGTESYPVSNTFDKWVPPLWNEFKERFEFEMIESEQVVVSDRHRYAGRFDLVGWCRYAPHLERKITIVDVKSNRGGPHGDVAVQNVLYAKADAIMLPDGQRRPLPKIEQSAVFWAHDNTKLQPGTPNWNLFPLAFNRDVWDIAEALLRTHEFGLDERRFIGAPMNGPEQFRVWRPW